MLNIERVEYIMKELREKKTVYVEDLAKRYFVSPSTIRRDLTELERIGFLRRTYGGAVLVEQSSAEIPFLLRNNRNLEEKTLIGEQAASLVQDGQYIFLDSTSTAYQVIFHLTHKANLKILTTSAQTALTCLDTLNAEVYCTGGWMSRYSRGFVGETARQRIAEFKPDMLFFSARSVSLSEGISDVNEEDVYLKKQMIASSRHAVFLCDHTKLDQTSYRIVCGMDQIDTMVCDRRPPQQWVQGLQQQNVALVYPGSTRN